MSDAAPSGKEATSIFLSYSRADQEQVLPLIEALKRHGFVVWWDGLLQGGDRFLQVTENALENADVVLVAWTKVSANSDWVRDEATRGRDRKCLLSVTLDGTEPPLGFRQIQYLDLTGEGPVPDRPGFARVLEALGNRSGQVPRGQASPAAIAAASTIPAAARIEVPTAVPTTRRGALIAGGAAVLVAGGSLIAWQSGALNGLLGSKGGTPNSLAVMTFENLSNDPDQDYFSAGLAEELRSILSLNRRLSVAAQTSTDKFAEGNQTASAIASALGVANVLEGSVRRAGDQLRVAIRLIDGATDLDIWSDVFDRKLDDVLAVQTEIATQVVDSLVAAIADEDAVGTARIGGTRSAKALDFYLRGLDLYGRSGAQEESDRAALAALDRAIEIDPEYGAAHAVRSRVLTAIGNRHASGDELKSYYRQAMEAAQTAIRIAPDLADGHGALGSALANGQLDIGAAMAPYERSFVLGYGSATILMSYTLFASYIGAFEKGRDAIARAERLDPLNAPVFRAEAVLEFAARDFRKASEAARRSLSLDESTSIANRILGDIALVEGRADAARAFYEKEPSILSRLSGLAILEQKVGNADAAQQAYGAMIDRYGDNSLYQQAQVLAQWGKAAEALETLERAFNAGDAGLVLSRSDQNLDPVRQTAEFESLQQRLGFT